MRKLINKISLRLLGRHRYRVKLSYRDCGGREVFNLTNTISAKSQSMIENHREIKAVFGPVHKIDGVSKMLLCNGSIQVEPVCYLGRWH